MMEFVTARRWQAFKDKHRQTNFLMNESPRIILCLVRVRAVIAAANSSSMELEIVSVPEVGGLLMEVIQIPCDGIKIAGTRVCSLSFVV